MYDYLVIGGSIVGLSTAWQLQQREPGKDILLVDKEDDFGKHQTGHNSGVIHAGIYYAPGSVKAEFCKAGVDATVQFCKDNGIRYEQSGKLLVATDGLVQQRMLALYRRARQNGLDVELLDAGELKRREPNVTGTSAIFVRDTGIVDYQQICIAMARRFRELGGEARLNCEITGLDESVDGIRATTRGGESIEARYLVACAGLTADRTAKMLGIEIDFQIVPFRGEYYRLSEKYNRIVNHLIYPIPDPALPFLGVHLTRTIDGRVIVGPNAVQGWKREGYGRVNVSLRDTWDMVRFPGFWKAAWANRGAGIKESWNSIYKPGYLKQVQRYCPRLTIVDLQPYPAGIRAQAVMRDGTLVDDFLFAESPRSLHVCNAPSPAATSAIPIGAHICDRV